MQVHEDMVLVLEQQGRRIRSVSVIHASTSTLVSLPSHGVCPPHTGLQQAPSPACHLQLVYPNGPINALDIRIEYPSGSAEESAVFW